MALAVLLGAALPARAAVVVADNEKVKLDLELRLMAWATYSGPDSLPGSSTMPPPVQEENISDLFVRRARLVMRAQIGKAVEIVFQVGQDNIGSKVLRDDAGFRFKDAYILYKRNAALQLVAGQFKIPFLRQNLASGFNQLLVDRSPVVSLRPAIEGSRDQGGMIWGNHKGLQYRAGVFDGSDQEDTNTRSSLRGAARLSWNWFNTEPGMGLTGTTLGQKKILQVGVQGDAQNGRLDSRDDAAFTTETRSYRAWAVDAYYDQPFAEGRWALTAEAAWLERRDDYDTDGLATRSIDGGYAQAGLLLPWHVGPGRFQIVGRYEEINTERAPETSEIHARTAGLTWFTTGHDRKIQFDHVDSHERPVDLDDNIYRLSFVLSF
ncbi:MAG TPA: porin [Candidatus Cryosericum sp.]|nr:porin [Candidatus Cryosericum sp.]